MDIISMIMSKNQSGEPLASAETVVTKYFETNRGGATVFTPDFSLLVPGSTWVVKHNGNTFECLAVEDSESTETSPKINLGNYYLKSGDTADDTGESFFAQFGRNAVIVRPAGDCTFEVYQKTELIHPIDPKYIPDTVATKADIFGAMEGSY